MMPQKAIDITGQCFSRLTVLERSTGGPHGAKWECLCVCGNIKIANGHDLRHGRTQSCGCLWRERMVLEPGRSARNAVLDEYQRHARNRGHEWQLTDYEFDQLTAANCYYCDQPPSQVRTKKRSHGVFVYTGIDRINNDLGYTLDNVLPCCGLCNRWKSDMDQRKFLDHAQHIARHME